METPTSANPDKRGARRWHARPAQRTRVRTQGGLHIRKHEREVARRLRWQAGQQLGGQLRRRLRALVRERDLHGQARRAHPLEALPARPRLCQARWRALEIAHAPVLALMGRKGTGAEPQALFVKKRNSKLHRV